MTIPPSNPLTTELTKSGMLLAQSVRAPLTLAGYRSDWRIFCAWCRSANLVPLPASTDTIALYVTALIRRCRIAIFPPRVGHHAPAP